MNKKDDRRGRAVPVQIPGARWGLCPPRDDVKTSSRGARIAGRGGEARVVEGRLAVLRRAFRAWKRRSSRAVGPALTLVRPPAWKRNVNPSSKPRPRAREAAGGHHAGRATPGAPPARSRDRPRPELPQRTCTRPALTLVRPPAWKRNVNPSSKPRPRARETAVGRERAGDLEPALPARRRPASRSPRPASSSRAPAGRTDCARGLRPTGAPGVPPPRPPDPIAAAPFSGASVP